MNTQLTKIVNDLIFKYLKLTKFLTKGPVFDVLQ